MQSEFITCTGAMSKRTGAMSKLIGACSVTIYFVVQQNQQIFTSDYRMQIQP